VQGAWVVLVDDVLAGLVEEVLREEERDVLAELEVEVDCDVLREVVPGVLLEVDRDVDCEVEVLEEELVLEVHVT